MRIIHMTKARSLLARLGKRVSLRRLERDDRGVAAVEFALLLPLMITLYLGSTEVTQGVLASRKMAIVSRTLSDITAQQPTATTSPCTVAGLCDSTMTSIFSAASVIMSPFSVAAMTDGTSTLTMTISGVNFVANATPGTYVYNGYEAQVKWSKTAASPNDASTVRSCQTKPIPVASTVAPDLTNLPNGLYGAGSLIVADVTYKYLPTFGQSFLAWSSSATYISMSNTTYMRPRNWTTYILYPGASAANGGGTGCTG